jgi:hypothetical protein
LADFVCSKLVAWKAVLGLMYRECDGMVESLEFAVFSINTDTVLFEVPKLYFSTPSLARLDADLRLTSVAVTLYNLIDRTST